MDFTKVASLIILAFFNIVSVLCEDAQDAFPELQDLKRGSDPLEVNLGYAAYRGTHDPLTGINSWLG
jgi:hypothetical protein